MPSTYEVNSTTRQVEDSFFEAVAGSSGAVPSTFTRARDIVSVTKDGTAHSWVFTFSKGSVALLVMTANIINATYAASTSATKAEILSETVNAAGKQVVVGFRKNDGTPVDLATGDLVKLCFRFKKSQGAA